MDPSKCDANRDLLSKIFEVIHWKWNAEIILIQRTANRVADMLARQAVRDQMTYTEWFLPPNPVLSVIQDDMHPVVSRYLVGSGHVRRGRTAKESPDQVTQTLAPHVYACPPCICVLFNSHNPPCFILA
ncbi:hypothetical protein PIB30_083918 [Stylosanthes scabra]|uniref:RNase H type-1 domain-containing protein n=1 Tax=Stylosanthes scabra TaxID=79078 RepID=A0ABU6VUF6_9FABA|nr:hypothetical protein [Stylosanthes scabra]